MREIKQISLVLLVATASCKPRVSHSHIDSSPEGRKIIGVARDYPPTLLSESNVKASMQARREIAWQIVEKVLAETPLALGTTSSESGQSGEHNGQSPSPRTLRLWQTWYQSDEFNVLLRELYRDLGASRRAAKSGFSPSEIDAKFAWLAQRDVTQFGWTADRFETRLQNIKTAEDVNGIPGSDGMAGRGMTFFSPALIQHVLANYEQILKCRPILSSLPPSHDYGPDNSFTPCFDHEFSSAAVAIKTAWLPAKLGVPRYRSDAEGLKDNLIQGSWQPVPDPPQMLPQPTPAEIYTMRARPTIAPVGPAFRLTGMHITTKETRHWFWISLWWSDDPDSDFGEDRPESIKALGGAWSNYKMCVVSSFREEDPAPWIWYETSHPSLAAALKASTSWSPTKDIEQSPHTWCSNPYIEKGRGNSRTNCIGCHQHAGSRISPDKVFADETHFPDAGRGQQRLNFPADYLWAFEAGNDMLEPAIAAETARQDALDRSMNR